VRSIRSSDGTKLAVYETGAADGPVIVAVHGYPDDHTVWSPLGALLADRFRVVTYDVRGAGASDVPAGKAGYRMPHLVDDLYAVLDAVAPQTPVHLLAHDWGSIQTWPALTDPRAVGRIASFTSISGPSLEHAGVWSRGLRADPKPRLRQLAHSYYTLLFQVPGLPEFAIRRGVLDRALGRHDARGRADQANGLNLYRANMFASLRRPAPARIDLPVQVITPLDDPFVTPALAAEAPRPFVADLRIESVPGGHWVVNSHPQLLVDLVAGHAAAAEKRDSHADR
jgi:pimeloyl-ACP methyl ester carboxylesterase